ncbi:MAG: DUF2236 domain-containing protein [Deltaproteobacteria bacterium]|nr:DUF2236 domain-containing protein [Deltaproteobacteria bacterium]
MQRKAAEPPADRAPPGTPVTGGDLESALERLRSEVDDPVAGLFGPGSKVWEVNREGVLFLGGGRAVLLQLAHPFVAHAIEQHSTTRRDPVARFQRTFEHVFAMVYGDLDSAIDSARRVHALHRRINGAIDEDVGSFRRGDPYAANVAEALLWVHATLWDTSVQVYELVVRKLSAEEKDRYWSETKRFALLFGIPEAILPVDWSGFQEYCRSMFASSTLAVGAPAAEMARFILAAPGWPLSSWFAPVTMALLPERIRHQYREPLGLAEQALTNVSLQALRAAWWAMPGWLRHLPAYRAAQRRIAQAPASRVRVATER